MSELNHVIGDLLASFGIHALTAEKSERSNVTTAWGVNWNEEMIARDLLQNFFDANRADLGQVRVTVRGNHVTVSGPATFALERLYYLGSEKGQDDIGQYGEGFKAAAMCLLRDHHVTPIVVSGNRMVRITVSETPVPGTNLQCLVYHFFTLDAPYPGTILLLPESNPYLIKAMQGGMTHFFYTGNPLVGRLLWQDSRRRFALYEATTDNGQIFYKNLKRGEIPNLRTVLVIHQQYQEIEKKIASDRDRNAFGEELLGLFFKTYVRRGLDDAAGMRAILTIAQPLWSKGSGHPLLAEMAQSCWPRYTASLQSLFGDGFFAESPRTVSWNEELRRRGIEEEWKREGRVCLPQYFSRFGVPSAEQYLDELDKRAKEEARQQAHRPLSPAENNGVYILRSAVEELAPSLSALLKTRQYEYCVAETTKILGELKQGRSYRSAEVFFAASAFEMDFGSAIALYLHEHAHIFGHDGSRGFTDALTNLLENVVRFRQQMDCFETLWNDARVAVQLERRTPHRREFDLSQLADMSEAELRRLVHKIPPSLLQAALGRHEPAKG